MIDAYDMMNLKLDSTEEDIKKAYKRLSLQYHPDKVAAKGLDATAANEKFNEIKEACDILKDPDRRQIYDTFGLDLGENRPEMEVWNIGLNTLLSPMFFFALKTILSRVALWVLGFWFVGRLLFASGVAVLVLYVADFPRSIKIRSDEATPILSSIGIVNVVLVMYWLWPLLADTVCVLYLSSEVVGAQAMFIDSWKIGAVCAACSLVVAWLVGNWWTWIAGFEVILAIVMLGALTVSAGIMRLWIDGVQAKEGEKLKKWRMDLRSERKKLQDEVESLKKKLEAKGG